MHYFLAMKRIGTTICGLALAFTIGLSSCATTDTSSTTWTDPNAGAPQWARPGRVEAVQEVVQHTEGNPVGGAIAGTVIGGLLFGGRGPAAVAGAAGGAAVGASASQGSSETRQYRVWVRFYDGGQQMFVYPNYSPFRPGENVVLTPQGLARG